MFSKVNECAVIGRQALAQALRALRAGADPAMQLLQTAYPVLSPLGDHKSLTAHQAVSEALCEVQGLKSHDALYSKCLSKPQGSL